MDSCSHDLYANIRQPNPSFCSGTAASKVRIGHPDPRGQQLLGHGPHVDRPGALAIRASVSGVERVQVDDRLQRGRPGRLVELLLRPAPVRQRRGSLVTLVVAHQVDRDSRRAT